MTNVLPSVGDRIGVSYFGPAGRKLPFTVVEISPRAVVCTSPIFGGKELFAFEIPVPGEILAWVWIPWSECPALMVKCLKCKGAGEIQSKKKGETFRQCPTCKGKGEVARDDPFAAQD